MATEYKWLDAQHSKAGGAWLRRLRESRGWTMRDVDQRSGGVLSTSNISELENGNVSKPSMPMLLKLGEVYGLTPNQIAEAYGWWFPPEQSEAGARVAELAYLDNVLGRLTPGARYNLLRQIETLSRLAERDAHGGQEQIEE
jgi:transcriptional regulator with XRE-family HTH domain